MPKLQEVMLRRILSGVFTVTDVSFWSIILCSMPTRSALRHLQQAIQTRQEYWQQPA
jgi:hypothetical protein